MVTFNSLDLCRVKNFDLYFSFFKVRLTGLVNCVFEVNCVVPFMYS